LYEKDPKLCEALLAKYPDSTGAETRRIEISTEVEGKIPVQERDHRTTGIFTSEKEL